MELSGHKKTPVRNRGFVPGLSEVVQLLWSRYANIQHYLSNYISLLKNLK